MKPEIRIALVKEVQRAKRNISHEPPGKWVRLSYLGAVIATLIGIGLLTSAVKYIATVHGAPYDAVVGSLLILISVIFMLAPWYFLVRYWVNRKMQLLCEAILSVGQFDGYIAG